MELQIQFQRLLSDGEFVFTAKAVKNLGVDKLRNMMAQAEEDYDAGQVSQEEAALGQQMILYWHNRIFRVVL